MTSSIPSESAASALSGAGAPGPRQRSLRVVAYVGATVLGGISALIVLVVTVASADDATAVDVLLWAALAVLLFGAAARQWFFDGKNDARSRRIVALLGPDDVAEAVEPATGEVDAIRRLRVAHRGLSLRDASALVKRHGDQQAS